MITRPQTLLGAIIFLTFGSFSMYKFIKGYGQSMKMLVDPNKTDPINRLTLLVSSLAEFTMGIMLVIYS